MRRQTPGTTERDRQRIRPTVPEAALKMFEFLALWIPGEEYAACILLAALSRGVFRLLRGTRESAWTSEIPKTVFHSIPKEGSEAYSFGCQNTENSGRYPTTNRLQSIVLGTSVVHLYPRSRKHNGFWTVFLKFRAIVLRTIGVLQNTSA